MHIVSRRGFLHRLIVSIPTPTALGLRTALWLGPKDSERLLSPGRNEVVWPAHNRMPVLLQVIESDCWLHGGIRQMAVVPRTDVMAWLDLSRSEAELLRALPAGSFRAERDDVGIGPLMFEG